MSKEKDIVAPLTGYCKQSAGTGEGKEVLHFLHPTKDARLWGKDIPTNVEAEKFMEGYIKALDESEKTYVEKNIKTQIIPVARNKNTELVGNDKVANFDVFPIHRVCFFDHYGTNIAEKETIFCKIIFDNGRVEQMEIKVSDVSRIAKKITDKYTFAIMNFSEPNVEKIIEATFRSRTLNVPIIRRLFEAGWQVVNGVHYYVNDSLEQLPECQVETGLYLPYYNNLTQMDIANIFVKAINLVKEKNTAYTIFLYSLMGVLFRPFEEAGYMPHFLLFINGKTGSMKTTIAKILFTQLADLKHREQPRRIDSDTVNSFERAIVLSGRDTTLLIDDYAPAKTPQKKADMQNRLENIVRMVGDGATKSRSNAKLEDVQGEGVKGMVVVTGEIQGRGVSSNLRCLYCTMKKSYADVENVSWFQQKENQYAYTTAIKHFTDFISLNWNEIVEYIILRFPIERKKISACICERRLIDNTVYLLIVADIFEKFMISYCDMDGLFISEIIGEMKNAVVVNAKINESMTKQEAHSQTFVKGIHTLMIMDKIRLYSGKMEAEHTSVYDGFEDEKNYYFIPEGVYIKVMDFLKHSRQYVPFDLKELVTAMYEDGIIKAHSNGNGKKTYFARIVVNGTKQRFLKINKQIFNSIIEGTFDSDGEEEF